MDRTKYITVTSGLRGYYAVLVWWNPGDFWEPYETSPLSFRDRGSAIKDAVSWALAVNLEYKPGPSP